MIIGSHVSMSAPDYLLGAVKEAVSYDANALMIYTGPPQNTRRKPISEMKVKEAHELMQRHGICKQSMIVHAPYIINLANCLKPETYELAVEFLTKEIERVKELEATYLVLHPGSHVKAGEEAGLDKIICGLDEAMQNMGNVSIALETMSGKGSELGYRFEQLRYIIDHVKHGEALSVCLDTCHIHDAGYDIAHFDEVLREFDRIIGLERLACIHVNDSKNIQGAKKDRHANIGFGEIGYQTLYHIVHHPRLENVVKILETPYIEEHPPYQQEIAMLKSGSFDEQLQEKIKQGVRL
ncbi:MAG: deoxyribonuclease IV [Erysipelotrichaceae bacterium]|nr:deoxyribonuclease IV [Erysipelotrichaceae bacterium]